MLPACGASVEAGPNTVVASFYPLAYAAEQVAPSAPVENLTPPGAEPHDLELSPVDAAAIRQARLVLLLGRGFQPQLDDAAGNGGNVLHLLDTAGLDLLPNGDPHVWLDPIRFADLAVQVSKALTGSGASAAVLAHRLEDLDAQYRAGLADCERRELVVSHAAFGYLADAYGLEQIPLAGLSPEAEATPRDLARAAELVEERGITTVFVEPLAAPAEAWTVARETGAKIETLDPIEGLTDEEAAAGEDYLSRMEANLRTLREALGCR